MNMEYLNMNELRGDSMKIEVGITSNRELTEQASDEAIDRALEAIGLQAEGYAKMLCPVDTGRLRNSITHTVDVTGHKAIIGTNVEYAAYVEMGTSRTKAQPYLQPAVMNHIDEYSNMAEYFLKNG